MTKINSFFKRLWKDESGQGTAEYIMLIAIVVALIVMFKERIKNAMKTQTDKVGGAIESFDGN